MFKLEQLFKKLNIEFKMIDHEGSYTVYKIEDSINLLFIESRNNQFKLERDWFDYLDLNSLPYSILLINKTSADLYYLPFSKKHNWIKSCFETCDKEAIFLGKQVLNSRISTEQLCNKLKM